MKKEDFKLTKSTIESYKIRHKCGMYWADISIDANGKQGRIQIASDFGDWQYFWGSCGCSFKQFLCGIDKGYTANKFGANQWFDAERTLKGIKLEVISQLKEGYIDSEKARDCWNEIRDLEGETSREAYTAIIYNASNILSLYDCGPDFIRTCSPGFNNFWDNIWPIFIEQLQTELTSCQVENV